MSQNLERLRQLLAEVFQLDQAELDFGIYRIMNTKREEITRFLDNDLLPQVREVLQTYEQESRAALAEELEKAKDQAKALGFEDPAQAPKVKELQARYAAAFDMEAAENEVYSHLYNFFRRYYSEGDFISQRRYKEGVYAIPYEGEEVKLYWANHDQYYIKTSEYLRNYTFKLPSGKRVHFKLIEADTEKDNNRALNGNERRFILSAEKPLAEENGELVIRFEYRPDPEKRKQSDLNAEAADYVLRKATGFLHWRSELAKLRPTEKNPNRTLLEKHLTDYTARNTFDYFIHKDMGRFLRRELDFYIKNEVMHLDDIENESAPRAEQYLCKIKAIRRIAHKIIDFLAQIENFQKKLWLKKKFVVETQYCVTLDRVPQALYPEIVANDAQREDWVRLFSIDEIQGNLMAPGYSAPLKVEFLKANPYLVLDTRHFSEDFKRRLLASFEDLDQQCDGLLIHSENFQALNLLMERYREQVGCVYIDPPYNTAATPILYKNDYKEASWLSLLESRLRLGQVLQSADSVVCVAIDDAELDILSLLLREVYSNSQLFRVVVNHYPGSGTGRSNVTRTHEYALFMVPLGLDILRGQTVESGERERNFRRSGTGENNFRVGRPNSFYAVLVDPRSLRVVGVEPPPQSINYPREPTQEGYVRIYPIGEDGSERVWTLSYDGAREAIAHSLLRCTANMVINRIYTDEERRNLLPSIWADTRFNAVVYGTNLLSDLFGTREVFPYPKSVFTVAFAIEGATHLRPYALVMDFFAGSGTTAHAVINLSREDGGRRKYILVEMGDYFDTVLVPRIKKVVYSKDWKDGKPVSREGISHMFKYIRLESYEDTLNNLQLKRSDAQRRLLEEHAGFREDYMLRYVLEMESRGSASLLNLDRFEDPFSYQLDIATGTAGETKPTVVDLVETFNYLIGLRVKTMDHICGVRIVTGTNRQGERVLVLWRNARETDNDKLDVWFGKQGYNTKDQEFDVIYVNGDNNLENLRKPDQTWKVRLIEEEFRRLMFDVQEV